VAVEVRYFAGAAAAAGTEAERVEVTAGGTVAALLEDVAGRRPALRPVLEVASVLVDEVVVRDRSQPLHDGAQVDVLPPFAGG
jgi:molybdopterin synthase sulfur carrier subunit